MKELRELIRDLREDCNRLDKDGPDYLSGADTSYYSENTYPEHITVHDANDVTCGIQILNSQNHKELARYLQYLERIEEYEASRKQAKELS